MHKLLLIFLRIIGIVLILVGSVAAYYGPLEIYVFYLFSDGGPFSYDGFGVGSFWFAALVVQNIAYYVVAAVCIPVGIGHLKIRRWAFTLTKVYIWIGLGTGILIAANMITRIPQAFNLELSRDLLLFRLTLIGIFVLVCLIFLPALALWFYNSEYVGSLIEERDPNIYWTEMYPFSLLVLLFLFALIIIVMHIAIFFQSLFPVFGQIMLGRKSVYLISLCILITGILMVGIARLKNWAWWGSLVYLTLLCTSSLISFSCHSFNEIILMMKLPAFEMNFLNRLSLLHNFHLSGLIASPLIVALGLLIFSKRFFKSGN